MKSPKDTEITCRPINAIELSHFNPKLPGLVVMDNTVTKEIGCRIYVAGTTTKFYYKMLAWDCKVTEGQFFEVKKCFVKTYKSARGYTYDAIFVPTEAVLRG